MRKVKAETKAKTEVGNHGNYFLIGLLTMALSTCFLNTNQDHLPRRGITHSGMGTPTSTRNQQNVLETLPIAILLEAVPQLCFFPFWGDSFCVKLIKTNKQNYLHFLSSWETQNRVCGGELLVSRQNYHLFCRKLASALMSLVLAIPFHLNFFT